jgi:hypothetical protein
VDHAPETAAREGGRLQADRRRRLQFMTLQRERLQHSQQCQEGEADQLRRMPTADCNAHAALTVQCVPQFGQGDVGRRRDLGQKKVGMRLDPIGPPVAALRCDAVRPISRQSRRMVLETLTPKRTAARRRDAPSSTARITRMRKSSDNGTPMHAGLLLQHAS